MMLKNKYNVHLKIYLLNMLFLINSYLGSCSKGCLRCDVTQNICQICDNISNYYDDRKGGCHQLSIPNCDSINVSGKCAMCSSGFKLESLSSDCIEILDQERVQNCRSYDADTNCMLCEDNFYLKNGGCRQVLVPIPGCLEYLPEQSEVCLKCGPNLILSKNRTSCESVSELANCAAYNYLDCNSCDDLNYYDPNAYMQHLIDESEYMQKYFLDVKNSSYHIKIGNFCLPKLDVNCNVRISNANCLKCNEGFYRNEDGKCIQIPQESLENCLIYKSQSICQECKPGHFLEKNFCKVTEKVLNCLEYSKTLDKCIRCENSHFLNEWSKCDKREITLGDSHCKVFEADADKCEQCATDYLISPDGTCVQGIALCEKYENNNTTCAQCADTHFYNSEQGWCEQPLSFATSPCLKYGNSEGECRECKTGFYLEGDCLPHTNLDEQCAESSQTVKNKCTSCAPGYALLENSKICKPVTVQNPNCIRWRSATECEECSLGFQAPLCTVIPAEENCLFKEEGSDECKTCREGYFKNENTNNLCITVNDFEKYFCEDFSLKDGLDIVQCDYCSKGTFFMEYQDFYGCELRSKYSEFNDCEMIDYDQNNDTSICRKCRDGKYLFSGECVDECPENTVHARTTISIDDAKMLGVTSINTCIENTDNAYDNCQTVVPAVDKDTNTFVCVQCKEGFNQIYDLINVAPHFSYNKTEQNYDDIVLREASFKCKALDMIEGYSTERCEAYAETSTGKHGCIRCQFGFTGYAKKPLEDEDIYFIRECVTLDGCNHQSNSVLGLTTPESLSIWKIPIETFVSCIECTGKDMMPVALLRQNEDQPLSPIWYNLLNYVTAEIPNTEVTENDSFGVPFNCLTTTVGSQYGYAEDFKVIYPNDCAMLMYRIDRNPNENLLADNPTVYCIACKQGYRVEERGTDPSDLDVVRKCQMIENCNQSSWYNYCSVCEPGFVYRFNQQNKTVEYDYCIKAPDYEENCYAMEEEGKCLLCKKGYSFNDEGICEDFNFANCEASTFLSRDQVYLGEDAEKSIYNMSLLLYLHGISNLGKNRYGCSKCTGDFIAVKGLKSLGHCVDSPYIMKNKFNELKFISNCLQFGWDYVNSKHVCKKCIPGYMPNFARTQCIPKLDYCLRGSEFGDSFCNECQFGFSLVKRTCILNDIKNCEVFGVENNSLVCLQCRNEYYLYQKKFCFLGNVNNCLQYKENSPDQCEECKQEHAVFRIQTGQTVCVPFTGQNCTSWDASVSNSKFECDQCNKGFYIDDVSIEYPSEICLGPMDIENCLQVSASVEFANMLTFTCSECVNNYFKYNSGTSCLRLDQVNYCQEYSTTDNYCEQCQEGYYLDYLKKNCLPFPEGIYGCALYYSPTECLKCQANKYLNNGNCVDIDSIDWIEHCEYYTSLERCSQCESGYFLVKNKCFPSKAKNCLTYASETECETCPEGYGFIFEEDTQVLNCTIVNIPNCLKPTFHYPFKCIICKKDYFQIEGACLPSEKIVNCEYYLSNKVCMACKKGYVKSWDGRACLMKEELWSYMDSNCTNSFFAPKMVCVGCRPGYFMSQGLCKACRAEANCMFCDPSDSRKCLVCSPGTFMDSEGQCQGNALEGFSKNDSRSGDNQGDGKDSVQDKETKNVFAKVVDVGVWLITALSILGLS